MFCRGILFKKLAERQKQDIHLQAQQEWKRKYAEGSDPDGLQKYQDDAKDSLKRSATEPITVQRKGFFFKQTFPKSVSSASNVETQKASTSSTFQKRKLQETSHDYYSFPNKVTAYESREEYLSRKELIEVSNLLDDMCPNIITMMSSKMRVS